MAPIEELVNKAIQAKKDADKIASDKTQAELQAAKDLVDVLIAEFLQIADRFTTIEQLESLPIPYDHAYGWRLTAGAPNATPRQFFFNSSGDLTCIGSDWGQFPIAAEIADFSIAKASLERLIETAKELVS